MSNQFEIHYSHVFKRLTVCTEGGLLSQANYDFLVNLEEELIKVLQAGKPLCDVYNHGVAYAKKEKPALVDNLTKNFG